MHAIFPPGANVALLFTKTSSTSYTVRVGGTADGKSFHSLDSCSR